MAEGAKQPRQSRTDLHGHPLAAWDNHQECRSCMQERDVFCTRGTPCHICTDWSEEMWRKWDSAIISASRKKAKRAWLAQQRALKMAGESPGPVPSQDLAPAIPSAPVGPTSGPKSRAVPALAQSPLTITALAPSLDPHWHDQEQFRHGLVPLPAQLDTRLALPGRGVLPTLPGRGMLPTRYRSPSRDRLPDQSSKDTGPVQRPSRRSGEPLMPPPRPVYDDRGRSQRGRERRERDLSMGPDRDWSPGSRSLSRDRDTERPKPSGVHSSSQERTHHRSSSRDTQGPSFQ